MICAEGKIALQAFIGSSVLFTAAGLVNIYLDIINFTSYFLVFVPLAIIVYILLKLMYEDNAFQIAVRAAFLGLIFTLGIHVNLMTPHHIQIFGSYMCVISMFHFSEYVAIAIVQPKHVSTDSFMINHSPQYVVAAVTSWVEFFIEAYLFPGLKQIFWLSNIGMLICILGEILRKTSMLTAGSSFNHLVQGDKASDHVLVTHGVYALFRHPSYVGWFYWSIGTQIVLLNPLCIPAYAIVSWLFFKSRIYIEEITLLNFFGQNYCDYQQKVGTGIPFIEGYKI